MYDCFSIKDKVIIVTGAGRGLGLNYASNLVKFGAKVAICDKMEENVVNAEKTIKEEGFDILAQVVDVTCKEQIDNFVNQVIKTYGRVDCLVNNAGVLLRRTPEEMTADEWDFMMDVNMKGTFLFSQAVGKHMIDARQGSIINIASIGGKVALYGRLGYCTTKAAVEHFTRVLAYEWGKYNVRVNAIAPGYIKSEMNADLRADPVRYKAMVDDVPLGRFGEPDDLIGTLVFLCSNASAFITGQTIYVDGGKTTH